MIQTIQNCKRGFQQLPPFTRTYLLMALLLSFTVTFTPFGQNYFQLAPKKLKQFQLWRLFSNFLLLGKMNFGLILKLLISYTTLNDVENNHRYREYADFCWMVLLLWGSSTAVGLTFGLNNLSATFKISILYIWSKLFPFREFYVYFVIKVRAGYLCWVILVTDWLFGESHQLIVYLLGILLGHLYYFFKFVLKRKNGTPFLQTPRFLRLLNQ